jgi:hypothetical protein
MSTKNENDLKKLNEEEIRKYYQDINIEYMPNKKITEKQFNENISKILKPNINIKTNSKHYSSEETYISKTSDPYKHLLNLKSKLLQNKENIDRTISKYNDIKSKIDLSDINNYSLLFSNLQKFKTKIDYFLNYDIIKKNQNNQSGSESDSDEIDEDETKKNTKKKENEIKNLENQKNILKKREENENLLKQIEESPSALFRKNFGINSLNEKYSSISNNLISKLNNIDSEVKNFPKLKIMGSIGNTTYNLKKKILDVENQINNLEEMIGDFDFTNHKDTIFGRLKYFLKMNLETNKDWISTRFKNTKIFEEMLGAFNKDPDNKKYLSLYKQICEEYMIYLTMEKFKDVISYLKKRLIGIKNIILNSEQFEYDINELNKLINENEKKYEILKYKYLQTLGSFDKLDNILKEINNLDNSIKNKI